MKPQFCIPRRQDTLTFESMAGRYILSKHAKAKASPLKERLQHEAQKVLCFACVSFAIVLLFAVLDFAG